MIVMTLTDYIGLSVLAVIALINMIKICLMLRPVSQTPSGRVLDLTENRDKNLEEKIKDSQKDFHKKIGLKDLKIIEAWNPYYGYVNGVNLFRKHAVMIVTPGLYLVDRDAFQWLYKHKAYCVLNHSFLKVQVIKTLSIMIASLVFTMVLHYSVLYSIFYTLSLGFIIEILCVYIVESRADSFSLDYASIEELKGALRFLQVAYEENKKKSPREKLRRYLKQPSFFFRMRRISKALKRHQVNFSVQDQELLTLRQLLEKNNLEEALFIETKKQQVLRWIDADED
jgi:hypothetical protein